MIDREINETREKRSGFDFRVFRLFRGWKMRLLLGGWSWNVIDAHGVSDVVVGLAFQEFVDGLLWVHQSVQADDVPAAWKRCRVGVAP